ncbi:3-phosphoshikimate 1-carboxyvinyltransferase [Reinekea marinisedimentorum]|uniref:3-phosphoshikimate 1-carboxyvinyltransferase n=1 Tax=Reinekea marinisedimentorum TaxID=230495 RepID=A0A4R3I6K4_9GAMM|nr:3-phosphoshikimate 1-carboxyvinyltransferase [Reinekea marinisedimentorum]TCS41734.1 3-phosphoshikimate 1-carboxyvinyltransferase [Reinekea marinisedimentorum]
MQTLALPKLSRAQGDITIPGSKSLSNRILLLAALCSGKTTVSNLLDSDDIRHMLTALKQLGVSYQLSEDRTECIVDGLNGPLASGQIETLFLGNAGTAMRPLAAALCIGSGEFELTGEDRMFERPIGDLITAMQPLGIDVEYLKDPGFPPLKIKAKQLTAKPISIDGSISSQFLTAVLMAAPLLKQEITIEVEGELVSKPYIDITLNVMKQFGVEVDNQNYQRFVLDGKQQYRSPGSILVEGDASSASYFLAAGAIGGGPVKVHGTGTASVQGDTRFAEVLEKMGATVTWSENWIEVSAKGPLKAVDLDLNHIPDAAMTIAVAALFAEGTTTIRNIYNWRVKETDRIEAMATELRKLGATVDDGHDYISVTPPASVKGAAIDTYNDHRIAMCFSLAAFATDGVVINDPGCTAKTFPDYFERFSQITE